MWSMCDVGFRENKQLHFPPVGVMMYSNDGGYQKEC